MILNQQLVLLEYGEFPNINRVYSNPQSRSPFSFPIPLQEGIIAGYLTLIPLYAIFLIVVPPLTLVLISVTIEREQKTLESLLLQPIERKSVVAGKLLYGVILVAFNTFLNILTIIFLIGLAFLISPAWLRESFITGLQGTVEGVELSLILFIVYLIAGLILVSVLMVTAAVIFSFIAKDEREANMVISALIIVPLIALFFLAFIPINIVPEILHIAIVFIPAFGYLFGVYLTILAGQVTPVIWLGLLAQFLWIILAIWLSGRLIESEGILEISFKRILRFHKLR